MKFGKILGLFFVLLLFVPATTHARNFLRTLKIGDSGKDVLFVQQILNLSPLTQVTQVGLGSPGNETVIFGNATRNAIIKFQILYASDILTPAGLTHATGVAGSFTLKKINELATLSNNAKTSTSSIGNILNTNQKTQVAQKPVIDSITPTIVGNGDTVIIYGKNFDTTNTVMVSIESDNRFTNIPSDGTTISFQFNSSLASALAKGMSNLTGDTRAKAIQYLIAKGKFVAGPGDGSAYTPVDIYVKSKNGNSNIVSVVFRAIQK